ncbi:hypothetical protein BDN70DRAFT_927604 [Pholiota conissans]|uniref:Glucose-methanol-choline oxidoreductase N-terminal domain-containing protein n=1 Tax=Pholiota conissans TaxID=109636 RepID=A0A9P5ZF81_9AGAR|nr:hypothetical protein BDN70DRAFT_927604 [Pholiota conissans]
MPLTGMWPFTSVYPAFRIQDIKEEYDFIIEELRAVFSQTDSLGLSCAPAFFRFCIEWHAHADEAERHQPELGRPFELVVGSTLGGTSRINQILYTRGLKREYGMWGKAGCPGWGWTDVGKGFAKLERALDDDVDPSVHGTNGEWCNRGPGNDLHFPGFKAMDARTDISLPYIKDLNSPTHPSIGCGLQSISLYTRPEPT